MASYKGKAFTLSIFQKVRVHDGIAEAWLLRQLRDHILICKQEAETEDDKTHFKYQNQPSDIPPQTGSPRLILSKQSTEYLIL